MTQLDDDLDEVSLQQELEDIRSRSAELPWYRRPRRLRRQVAGALVVTALTAVALFGGLSYFASDQLLRRGANDQLTSVAETRAVRIEAGTNRLLAQVATLSSDLGIARALTEFDTAFSELDETLTSSQQAELDLFYQERVVDPINDADLATITVDDVAPRSDAGRWVQYYHVLPDADPADDTSSYGDAIRTYGDDLQAMAAAAAGDSGLLLISFDNEAVVYSTVGNIDVGTSLTNGPWADSSLAELVRVDLGRVRAGRGVLSDYEIYLPNQAEPTLFAAAAVRNGNQVIGAVVMQLQAGALDAITTANSDWERIGLGTGESYVVSSDLVLQSVSRPWLEDPEGYLERVDDPEERRLIELFGSPVGVQTVDTEPVREALLGEQFSGRTSNYLGEATYSSSTAIDVPGVQWVVVTDVPVDDARKPVNDFVRRMLFVALIVVPLAALIGVLIARRLSRPIGPAVDAARAVAEGERSVQADSLGNDEFGDLGRRLDRMAVALGQQEAALSDEFEHKRNMMLSVLPTHMVGDDGTVLNDETTIDEATAVSISIDTDELDLDPDELNELLGMLSEIASRLVEEHGLRRIRVAADRALYVAGLGDGDHGVGTAVSFVQAVWQELDERSDASGVSTQLHIGVSTGAVATGVLSHSSLTYGAWGEPVRRALAIGAFSVGTQALLDASTYAELPDDAVATPLEGLVDLDGQPMDVYLLERSPSSSSPAD